jgi:DNA-binding NtrC family response regulator
MGNKHYKILISDDEDTLRNLLAQELTERGFDTYPFQVKTDAYVWMKYNKPDVIISDIKSIGMSGYEFLELLKANPYTKDIPFIFVTGFAGIKYASLAHKLGAADYINKPWDLDELLRVIERVICGHTKHVDESPPKIVSRVDLTEMIKTAFSNRN